MATDKTKRGYKMQTINGFKVVNTDAVSRNIRAMMEASGSKFFSVSFINKAGEERKLQGRVFHDKAHDGPNNAAHFQKYVLIVARGRDENGKRKFRNVNTETITRLAIGGRVIHFQAKADQA